MGTASCHHSQCPLDRSFKIKDLRDRPPTPTALSGPFRDGPRSIYELLAGATPFGDAAQTTFPECAG